MTVQVIASKFRRALRNGTGMNLKPDELRALGDCGVLMLLAQMEVQELCPVTTAPTDATRIGSTNGGTGALQPFGRSLDMSEAQSFIAALASER